MPESRCRRFGRPSLGPGPSLGAGHHRKRGREAFGSTRLHTPVRVVRHAVGVSGATTTVLVVDDEPIVRDVVIRYLRHAGYQTQEAADGDEARRLIADAEPGLVVLDVMLPGTDGLALCRWIRSRSALPIIML